FFRVDEITGRPKIAYAVDELFDPIAIPQCRDINREAFSVEIPKDGLACHAAVVDVQVRITVALEISLDVGLVVKRHVQNAVSVIRSRSVFGKIPKFHLISDAFIHQVNPESIDVEAPIGLIFKKRKSLASRWFAMVAPI